MSAPMSHAARDLAASRARGPHTSMFLRLVRAAVLREAVLPALFAMVVAAAVATAMLNCTWMYRRSFGTVFNYGANIIVVARTAFCPRMLWLRGFGSSGRGIAAPSIGRGAPGRTRSL